MKKIVIFIEKSSTGYGTYSDDLAGITGYGKTIEEAKQDIKDAIEELLEGPNPDPALNNGKLKYIFALETGI